MKTTTDALRLIMAARQGIIPRITRPLNDFERRSTKGSGAVFVFCAEESGIKLGQRVSQTLSWSRIVSRQLWIHGVDFLKRRSPTSSESSHVGTLSLVIGRPDVDP